MMAAPRPEAYPHDPSFPQLARASDAAQMLAIFREHLRPVAGKAVEIVDCAPFRFRCRQSETRCVLQYTLRLKEPGTGRRWDQWVTGLIYAEPGEAERMWRKLREGEPGPEIPEPWGALEPVGFVPGLDMVVEVFPYDRRLPQLGRVMNGVVRSLSPLLLERLGPGRWQAGEPAIAPSRYRTELGAVLRVAVPAREEGSGRRETPGCYVKVYRNERGRETFELLRAWAEGARPGRRPYALVRPLTYLEEHRALVLEEAPGSSLRDLLLEARDPVAAMRTVARAVAAFHEDDLEVSRRYSLEEHREDLRRAAALVLWACPEKRAKFGGVAAVVEHALEDVAPAPIHRDLTPEHVFLAGNHVTFVDADSIALGDPLRDPALLLAHIAGRVGLDALSTDQARAVAVAFGQEYLRQVPASWRKRFRLHCAGAFIEVAAGIMRSQGPGWRERVGEVASSARHALVGEFG